MPHSATPISPRPLLLGFVAGGILLGTVAGFANEPVMRAPEEPSWRKSGALAAAPAWSPTSYRLVEAGPIEPIPVNWRAEADRAEAAALAAEAKAQQPVEVQTAAAVMAEPEAPAPAPEPVEPAEPAADLPVVISLAAATAN